MHNSKYQILNDVNCRNEFNDIVVFVGKHELIESIKSRHIRYRNQDIQIL